MLEKQKTGLGEGCEGVLLGLFCPLAQLSLPAWRLVCSKLAGGSHKRSLGQTQFRAGEDWGPPSPLPWLSPLVKGPTGLCSSEVLPRKEVNVINT